MAELHTKMKDFATHVPLQLSGEDVYSGVIVLSTNGMIQTSLHNFKYKMKVI
jgi:hypothetical protein